MSKGLRAVVGFWFAISGLFPFDRTTFINQELPRITQRFFNQIVPDEQTIRKWADRERKAPKRRLTEERQTLNDGFSSND